MADNKKRALWINGRPVPVTEQVYKTYYKMDRREKYLEESDVEHGKVNYHALDTDTRSGEEILADNSHNVEDEATLHIMADKLRESLALLDEQERELINVLYFEGKSERAYSIKSGIPQKTINDRRHRILDKLKKLMET